MKKLLSMALVLIMVLTMISAMTVTVMAEEIPDLDQVRTETVEFDFSSGVKETGLSEGATITELTSADGNFRIISSLGTPSGTYTKVDGVSGLKHDITDGRFGLSTPNFYWTAGRSYVYKAKVHNPQSSAIPSYWCARRDGTTGYYFANGSNAAWAGNNPGIADRSIASGTQYVTLDMGSKIPSFSSDEAVYGKAFAETVKRDSANAGKYQVLLGCTIQETVTTHGILGKENMTGGSVKLNAKSLNFDKHDVNGVALSADTALYVEHRMPATVDITAPEGKVIKKATWIPYGGAEVDLTDDVAGKSSASVSLGSVLYSGEVSVEYGEIEQYNLEYITLADNKTLYLNGEKAAGSDVTVFGYTADGTKVSVAGHSFTTVESDNEAVFTVQDGKVSTTDNFGFATISATYNNKDGTKVSASVMFQRSQYGNAHVDESGVSNYISTDIAGRNADSVVYKTKQANDYIVRAYSGGDVTDYRTSTDRTTVGWFYDDMTSDCYAYYRSYIKSNAGNILFVHAESYGLIKAGDTVYGTNVETGKVNTVPRSKGWHQVVATITDSGYRLGYVDGVLVFKAAIDEGVVPSDKASRLELRGQGIAYFADFAVTDYVGTKENYTVTLDAENGTIEGPATVAHGETAEYTFTANDGYDIPSAVEVYDYAGINNQTITVTGGKFSLKPSDDTIIKAVFTEKVEKAPSVLTNTASDTGAYNKEVTGIDGNPFTVSAPASITAYATIDEGYGYEISEYGIELEKNGKSVALKGRGTKFEGQYAIVAYGAAIASGEYRARAYVKFGDETAYGEWNTVVIK